MSIKLEDFDGIQVRAIPQENIPPGSEAWRGLWCGMGTQCTGPIDCPFWEGCMYVPAEYRDAVKVGP